MERLVIQPKAQNHINAYLEYRMIVGGDPNAPLLSEKEYEKKKRAFYEKRKRGRAHILRTTGGMRGGRRAIGGGRHNGNGRRVGMMGIEHHELEVDEKEREEEEEEEDEGYGQMTRKSHKKMRMSPLDLLNTEVQIKKDSVPIMAPQRNQRTRRRGGRNRSQRGGRSRTHITDLSLEEQAEIIEEKLTAPNITKTTKYGLEKQLKVIRAKIKRQQRLEKEKLRKQGLY